MVDVLIVEDEPPAARRMTKLIGDYIPDANIQHATDLPAAQELLSGMSFDFICLDLNLRGEDGFQVLKSLTSECAVIVVSAHTERALEAFDHGVTDFVPKPVSAERLHTAIDRALGQGTSPTDTIAIRSHKGIDIVPLEDIVSVTALEDYVQMTLGDGRTYIDDRSLSAIEERARGNLIRIHRSHLASRSHIREIRNTGSGTVARLSNGAELPIARRKVKMVKAAMAQPK